MNFDSLVKQLANRINQPHVIRHYLLVVWRTALKESEKKQLHIPVVSNWVTFEENPPKEDGRYLIKQNEAVYIADYYKEKNTWMDDDINKMYGIDFWMHLPE